MSIWFHTPDELKAGVQALGTHPSFVQWYRDDLEAWPAAECRLESMFSADQTDDVAYALRGLCSPARLGTGKVVGAWLNIWHSNEEGAASYPAMVASFEFPIEVELYVFPSAHEDVAEAELDAWLVEVARRVYRRVPFRVAVIDFEVTDAYEDALSRSEGVLREDAGELRWHPYVASETDQ